MSHTERELPDDYPLYLNYLYVCEGKVFRNARGCANAKEMINLLYSLNLIENLDSRLYSCDIAARKLYECAVQ